MLQTSWLLLVVGTVGAIAASVSGLVTAFFIAATIWRFISRRRGSDCGGSVPFLMVVLMGAGLLVMSGMTGGDLVFDYGINVRGVNPLLDR